jgi:hypothetical protein
MNTVTFHCGGCDAVAPGTRHIQQHFRGFNGKGYGFGKYEVESVLKVVPDGWVAFDLIGATYCPKCAAEIFPEGGDGKITLSAEAQP